MNRPTAAWSAVVLAGAADVATTHVGLTVGLMEGNPVVAPPLEAWGSWFLVAFKAVVIAGAYGVTRWMPRPAPAVTAEAISVVWMFAVGWNLTLVRPAVDTQPFVMGLVFACTAGVVFATRHATGWLTRQTETSQEKAGVGA